MGEVISMDSRWLASESNLEASVMASEFQFAQQCAMTTPFASASLTHVRFAASASGCISKLLHQQVAAPAQVLVEPSLLPVPLEFDLNAVFRHRRRVIVASNNNARSQLLRLKQSFV